MNTRIGATVIFMTMLLPLPQAAADLSSVHLVRQAVEIYLDGKLSGVGSLQFRISSYVTPKWLRDDHHDPDLIVFTHFPRYGDKKVGCYVRVLQLDTLRSMPPNGLAFTGTYGGSPFSGTITDCDSVTKKRLHISISGYTPFEITDLRSDEAKRFKSEFLDKVDLGS